METNKKAKKMNELELLGYLRFVTAAERMNSLNLSPSMADVEAWGADFVRGWNLAKRTHRWE